MLLLPMKMRLPNPSSQSASLTRMGFVSLAKPATKCITTCSVITQIVTEKHAQKGTPSPADSFWKMDSVNVALHVLTAMLKVKQ